MAAKFLTGIDVNSQRILAVADPSGNTDGANKQYVDNKITGLSWKEEVRGATTTNGTLASAYANGSSLDGLTLATGDRILVKDQTTQTENGIYTVNASGAPTRTTDADSATDLNNATVLVTDGTVNTGKAFTQSTKNPTVGSSNIVFVAFGGGTTYTAGNGLTGATTFTVLPNGTSIDVTSSGVKIAPAAAGAGLVESAGVLAVNPGTGVLVTGDQVTIDASITARKNAAVCATSNPWIQAHGFGHADLHVTIREVSTGAVVYADVVIDATNVTVTLAAAPSAGQYRMSWTG